MGFGNKRFRKIKDRQSLLKQPADAVSGMPNADSSVSSFGSAKSSSEPKPEHYEHKHHTHIDRGNKYLNYYDRNYKKLLIIPMIILFLSISMIVYEYATTGDFMEKGVSLKGGVTINVPTKGLNIDIIKLEEFLKTQHPTYDINTRAYTSFGTVDGVFIEADAATKEEADKIVASVSEYTKVNQKQMSVDLVGSALGASFFQQTIIAMLVAYVCVSIIVFMYFRTFLPSFAVVLAGFSTIVETLAMVDFLGIKVTTAGIAAFLMLIGYSIDTDILLTVRVLKRKEGDVFSRIMGAIKTGLTMNLTTMAAVFVGMMLSQSTVLTQIMTIIFIGMCFDMINTWIQNVAILRMYTKRKGIE
jgi:preprotein translocase subunit SecF